VGVDRRRLASYVVARRSQLGWNADALAKQSGVSAATISALETGKSVRASTLGKVENALGWRPGSAVSILSGGEPIPLAPPVPRWTSPPSPEELRAELERGTAFSPDVIDMLELAYRIMLEARQKREAENPNQSHHQQQERIA
jgi:transcriptional regulator with XRE-family HTH domain